MGFDEYKLPLERLIKDAEETVAETIKLSVLVQEINKHLDRLDKTTEQLVVDVGSNQGDTKDLKTRIYGTGNLPGLIGDVSKMQEEFDTSQNNFSWQKGVLWAIGSVVVLTPSVISVILAIIKLR